ncbi:MAG: response regulator [Candidatus Schekmanbacteria bacterium]|nr:response regulator [Candidatus Schekmanbacteria bacterium]
MTETAKHRILCVDDEPNILAGLSLHLRRLYELQTATSGAAGLEILERDRSIAVVLSDMRMPGMDGATFLARARQVAPSAIRMLLTGTADIDAAVAAINEGQIFRFLFKPCPATRLQVAVAAAVEQHELITAERVLLEQTLHGSIKALTDILALVSPISFGRATRIKQLVSDLAAQLAIRERWQVEVAAMLSQIGYLALPPETAEKAYYGHALTDEEQRLVSRLPALTEELLGNIPRLEAVQEILRRYPKPYQHGDAPQSDALRRLINQGAQLLKVAVDFDALESREGVSASVALSAMRSRAGQYASDVLQALIAIRGTDEFADVREVSTDNLRVGMVLAEDVKMQGGALFVARGYQITSRFLERLRNHPATTAHADRWRVYVRPRQE